ncbi:RHS repeat-associated core domain-containing protein [Nocardiopsis lambiniae]|uniref:RHS repeat-associated core domain-containing protein n=1 Tax=Nocardiopsis lambiniae TaxID=3075539 RepID=A0ABU2MFJ7_9ACTN|nr:RHS repeat-associated core domain-containing protein [Nocardiopsis sp. DSM 44743]MDT0331472.1 RHS repeat-associated core domain-containing protein [Nocardiopsis sp. DSM 44743]
MTPHGDSPARPGRIRKGLTYTTALIVVAGLLNALPASALAYNPRPEVEDLASVAGSDLVSEAIAQDDAVAEAAVTEPESVDWPEEAVLDVDLAGDRARTFAVQEESPVTITALTGEELADWEVPEHWEEFAPAPEEDEPGPEAEETPEPTTPDTGGEEGARTEPDADSPVRGESGDGDAEPSPSADPSPSREENRREPLTPDESEPALDPTLEPEPVEAVQVEVLDRETAEEVGVNGLLVHVTRTDDSASLAPVRMDVDYSDFAAAFGGDYASRLHVVELDPCVLDDSCAADDTVAFDSTELIDNNVGEQNLSAVVTAAPAQGALFALAAAPAGGNGDYGATQLSASSTWNVNAQAGDFSWSYGLNVPPAPSQLTPSLGVGYSSGGIDGRIATSNNQTSWIGDGFAYAPGAIERRYAACSDAGHDTGDLCWNTDNVTLSMSGHSGALIKHSDGTYRLSNDDGTKVERLTGATNGAHQGEYWKVTTPDGTQYFFGRNRLPGWASGDPETKSAQTMPVYSTKSGQPCYNSTFSQSWCQQAYKWNLDYVVDVHGNVMTFYYTAETNNYGRNLTTTATPYVRAANIARIEYGLRSSDVYATAPARVVFSTSERCLPTSSFDCAADKRTSGQARHWPDVPLDLDCKSGTSCAGRHTPTFWSTKKLDGITTQIREGSEYTKVDTWAFEHSFPEAGDGTGPTLWLDSIEHTGHVGGTATLPKVTFAGTQLPNRVDSPTDDIAPMLRWRITSIYTETGGHLDITYSEPECEPGKTPQPHNNTKRCYPVKWTPEGGVELTDWFHKYVVTQVNELDLVTDQPAMTTSYDYVGTPAWRYTEADGMVKDKYRTWGDWRGYDRVIVRTGRGEDPISETEYLYFQGMDGDKQPSGTRSVSVTDSRGVSHTDHKELNGTLRETIVRDGAGGEVISREISTPWLKKTAEVTHSWGSQSAHMIQTQRVDRFAVKSDGTWFHTRFDNTINDRGAVTRVRDFGDVDVTGDEKCVNTTYVHNTDKWILNLVSRSETLAIDCQQTAQRPGDVVTDERVFYDGGAHGAAPTRGLPTKTEKLDTYTSGNPVYQTVSQAAFDARGNTVSETDANGGVSTTAYSFTAAGLPNGVTETNPLGHVNSSVIDPARGLPLSQTDANGRTMHMAYDPLGRLTSVWLPDRRRDLDTPTAKFEYHIRQDAPTSIVTHTLNAQGGYTTGYEIFDAHLRLRQTQAPAVNDGRLITDTFHDSRGQVVKVRSSYHNAAEPSDTLFVVANDAHIPQQSETVYDGHGRVTDVLHVAFGEERWRVSTEYRGEISLLTPADGGIATASISDAHGRLVESRTYTGGTPEGDFDAITYAYTPQGRLETVTDPEGNTWSHGYDLRGRLVETEDPVAGTTTMTYDRLDQMVTKTDARGETLAYVYDAVGRQTELRDDSPQGTLRASWVYDTLAKGHLTSATRYADGNAYTNRVVTYDTFYRPTTTEVLIPSSEVGLAGRYRFVSRYNLDGTLKSQTYPAAGGLGQETFTYTYNDLGLPLTAGGYDEVVTDTVYSQLGELRQIELDTDQTSTHATWITRHYDPTTGRMSETSMVPQLGVTGSLAHQFYAYDDAGNILNLRNEPTAAHLQADVQCYDYDHMRRLTDVWTPDATGENACQAAPSEQNLGGASPYWHSYTYDTLGNRTTETRHDPVGNTVRTYTHGDAAGLRPQTLTQVQESGPAGTALETYAYDASGNMTGRTTPARDQELEWDAEGKLASVTEEDGGVTSYVYDADGGRLIRHAPDASTLYLPGMELRLDKTSLIKEATRFYSFAGEGVAVRNNDATLSWLHSDHHGTGQVAVDARTGAETHRYMTVFGQDRMAQGAWPSEKGFVGGTVDESTGLTQLGARAYDASLGRFISVDPLMDVTDHQQMHGYSYANNNPATFEDSSGLMLCIDVCGPGGYLISPPTGNRPGSMYDYSNQQIKYHSPQTGWTKWYSKPNVVSRGGGSGGSSYQSQASPEHLAAQREIQEAKQKLIKAATGLAQLVADELGITAGLECFTTGNLAACGETALNIALMFVGGLPAKIAAKYGLRWGKAVELGRKIAELGGELVDGIKGLIGAKKKLDALPEPTSCPIGNSFVPGTRVVMADGSTKPIENVEIGDEVLATDPETGEQTARTVLATIVGSGAKALVEITIDPTTERDAPGDETVAQGAVQVDTESAGIPGPVAAGDVIVATDGHPFWVPDLKAWVDAIDLAPGMWLQTSAGTWVQINAIQTWSLPATVHNLTVQGVHTYHVAAGSLDVLNHNCDDGGFKNPVTASEISDINESFGGRTLLHGSPEGTLANASRYTGFWRKSAVIIRDVAGGHMFDNGNKRTAHAVVTNLMERNNIISGPTNDDLWRVIATVSDSRKPGHTMDVDGIASRLRGY